MQEIYGSIKIGEQRRTRPAVRHSRRGEGDHDYLSNPRRFPLPLLS
jgi:hypothetical protein